MKKYTAQTSLGFREKFRAFAERLRGLNQVKRRMRKNILSKNVNDDWLTQNDDLSWREYGDGGDCWWSGAS